MLLAMHADVHEWNSDVVDDEDLQEEDFGCMEFTQFSAASS